MTDPNELAIGIYIGGVLVMLTAMYTEESHYDDIARLLIAITWPIGCMLALALKIYEEHQAHE